jgi:hypothetical protein
MRFGYVLLAFWLRFGCICGCNCCNYGQIMQHFRMQFGCVFIAFLLRFCCISGGQLLQKCMRFWLRKCMRFGCVLCCNYGKIMQHFRMQFGCVFVAFLLRFCCIFGGNCYKSACVFGCENACVLVAFYVAIMVK